MYALSLLDFKDIGYKFESHIWDGCHDILVTAHELKRH